MDGSRKVRPLTSLVLKRVKRVSNRENTIGEYKEEYEKKRKNKKKNEENQSYSSSNDFLFIAIFKTCFVRLISVSIKLVPFKKYTYSRVKWRFFLHFDSGVRNEKLVLVSQIIVDDLSLHLT